MSTTVFTVRAEAAPRSNGVVQRDRPHSGYAMPWGKHKGAPIHEVPDSYLRWCLGNASNLTDDLRAEIEIQLGLPAGSTRVAPEEEIRRIRSELERVKLDAKIAQESLSHEMEAHKRTARRMRLAEDELADLRRGRKAGPVGSPKVEALRGVVKKWYRQLSMRFHPDRGGSNEQAVVVNEAYRTLMTEVEQWERS